MFTLTMPDKKKQKLYLANYVSFGNSAKRFDAVVEATGEANIGKSFCIVRYPLSRAHILCFYI